MDAARHRRFGGAFFGQAHGFPEDTRPCARWSPGSLGLLKAEIGEADERGEAAHVPGNLPWKPATGKQLVPWHHKDAFNERIHLTAACNNSPR